MKIMGAIGSISMLLLATGCSAMTPTNIDQKTDQQPDFSYTIDQSIYGKYGARGEVGWQVIPSARPAPFSLEYQDVLFETGATDEDIDKFQSAFQAVLIEQETLPGTPDGSRPPVTTNKYRFTYLFEDISLNNFAALAAQSRQSGNYVFSSEQAAKTYYQFLRINLVKSEFRIRSASLNVVGCHPEDCAP